MKKLVLLLALLISSSSFAITLKTTTKGGISEGLLLNPFIKIVLGIHIATLIKIKVRMIAVIKIILILLSSRYLQIPDPSFLFR